ncbi:hypothetical protein F5884DRAFT_381490 [Xylogone sp. PMI_703]|nr:hypothetical protein F5884DRAFT_381490 [Xylogone sp. PMI_703]
MSDDDTYEIPLQDQRVFGAGLKRKRINFVPSSSATELSSSSTPSSSGRSISERYLERVLSKQQQSQTPPSDSPQTNIENDSTTSTPAPPDQQPLPLSSPPLCEVCNLPLTTASTTPSSPSLPLRPHEASLSHQVCLAHSHPPSHLDRRRKGLTILSSQGWDPDSRLGLGSKGQGIQFPIKAVEKHDKMGLGLVLPPEEQRRKKEKRVGLDAGKVRKLVERDRRKAERLREAFYRDEKVMKYLGGGDGF